MLQFAIRAYLVSLHGIPYRACHITETFINIQTIISMLEPQQTSPVTCTSTDTSVDDLNTDIEIV